MKSERHTGMLLCIAGALRAPPKNEVARIAGYWLYKQRVVSDS